MVNIVIYIGHATFFNIFSCWLFFPLSISYCLYPAGITFTFLLMLPTYLSRGFEAEAETNLKCIPKCQQ